MIGTQAEELRERIEVALSGLEGWTTRQQERIWVLNRTRGPDFEVTLCSEEDWLRLESSDLTPTLENWEGWGWKCLQPTHGTGTARLALRSDGRPFWLADAPLLEHLDVDGWIRRNLDGLLLVAKSQVSSTPIDTSSNERERDDEEAGSELGELLTETGWPFHLGGETQARIDLEVSGFAMQARAETGPGNMLRLEVELASGPGSSQTQTALTLFLLACHARFRMARCSWADKGEATAIQASVQLDLSLSSEEIGRALSALSILCQNSAREAQALFDPGVAGAYRALRQCDPQNYASIEEASFQTSQIETGGEHVHSNNFIGSQ